jgi:hypothetical protein
VGLLFGALVCHSRRSRFEVHPPQDYVIIHHSSVTIVIFQLLYVLIEFLRQYLNVCDVLAERGWVISPRAYYREFYASTCLAGVGLNVLE